MYTVSICLNLVIFEVFGVTFSAKKSKFSKLPNKTSPNLVISKTYQIIEPGQHF